MHSGGEKGRPRESGDRERKNGRDRDRARHTERSGEGDGEGGRNRRRGTEREHPGRSYGGNRWKSEFRSRVKREGRMDG